MQEKAHVAAVHTCVHILLMAFQSSENVSQWLTICIFSFIQLSLGFYVHEMGIIVFFSSGFVSKHLAQCFTFDRHSKTLKFFFHSFEKLYLSFAYGIWDLVLDSYTLSPEFNIGSVAWFLFEIWPIILSC